MASHKIVVLQRNKRRDGSMPVCVRVTHKRETFFIKTPYYVFAKQVDKDGNIKDSFLRPKINLLDNTAITILAKLGFAVDKFTAKELKIFVESKLNGGNPSSENRLDFFEFAKQHIEKMKADGRDSAKNYIVAINNLAKFLGRDTTLAFNEITANFCQQYHQWMVAQKLGARGQELYFSAIRKLFSEAVAKYNDYDKEIIPIRTDPFRRFKIPQSPSVSSAEHRALPAEAIREIFSYQPNSRREELAKDAFMLSFCLCGMNAKDLYTCATLKNNVLIYNRSKTKNRRSDGAEMRITIPNEALHLAAKYKGQDGRVFSFAQRYSTVSCFNAALNKGLASIRKHMCSAGKFSFYSARHSWATIAVNDLQLPEEHVDDCLAHAPVRRMLHKYVKRDWTHIDAANRKVLDYVFQTS
jgi:integrase